MVILHLFHSLNRKYAGADVAIPEHIKAHQKFETVACVNIANVKIDGLENQFEFTNDFKISNLKEPFNKPNIIIFHEIYYPKFLSIAKEARKRKIPYIIIPHGGMTRQAQKIKRLKKIAGNILFFNKFMNGASAIQYLSEDEKIRTFKNRPCFVSTNGLNMPNEQKNVFNEKKIVFSYIGRYSIFHKGIDLLIDAIKQKEDVLRQNNCVFNLYGPLNKVYANDVSALRSSLIEKGISDIVSVNGPVLGEEKKNVLLSMDVFIQTSRFEGMPMGVLEAMSYGVPCLVTKGTYLKDFVDKYNSGWGCETTADDIAGAIEKAILEKRLFKEKSSNAINLIKNEFLWDNVANDALENYRKFI